MKTGNAATDAINAVKLLDRIDKEPLNPYEHRRFYEEVQEFLKSYWGAKYKGTNNGPQT